MMDKDTGRPRGFGFVTFDGDAAVDAALRQPLAILGKPIEVKRAQPRGNLKDDDDHKPGRFGPRGGGRHHDRFHQEPQQNNYDDSSQNGAQAVNGQNNFSPK